MKHKWIVGTTAEGTLVAASQVSASEARTQNHSLSWNRLRAARSRFPKSGASTSELVRRALSLRTIPELFVSSSNSHAALKARQMSASRYTGNGAYKRERNVRVGTEI